MICPGTPDASSSFMRSVLLALGFGLLIGTAAGCQSEEPEDDTGSGSGAVSGDLLKPGEACTSNAECEDHQCVPKRLESGEMGKVCLLPTTSVPSDYEAKVCIAQTLWCPTSPGKPGDACYCTTPSGARDHGSKG